MLLKEKPLKTEFLILLVLFALLVPLVLFALLIPLLLNYCYLLFTAFLFVCFSCFCFCNDSVLNKISLKNSLIKVNSVILNPIFLSNSVILNPIFLSTTQIYYLNSFYFSNVLNAGSCYFIIVCYRRLSLLITKVKDIKIVDFLKN